MYEDLAARIVDLQKAMPDANPISAAEALHYLALKDVEDSIDNLSVEVSAAAEVIASLRKYNKQE